MITVNLAKGQQYSLHYAVHYACACDYPRWCGRIRHKINTHVCFPLTVDLQPYCSLPSTQELGIVHFAVEPCDFVYDLSSVIIHHGTGFSSGHYTCYCWNSEAGRDRLNHVYVVYDVQSFSNVLGQTAQISGLWSGTSLWLGYASMLMIGSSPPRFLGTLQ